MKASTKKHSKKGRKSATAWPIAYRWAAIGTMVLYTAVGSKTVTTAYAQENRRAPGSVSSPDQTQAMPVRRFDISPGLLDAVLTAFQNASGLHVETASEGIRSLSSPGVSGLFRVDQALEKLLAGSGVTYRFTAADAVTLDLQQMSTTVEVTATMPSVASAKYTEPLRDTAQSITVVSHAVMEAQGATTLRDALRNVSGISLAAGEGGSQGDNLTIRGFTARNDIFNDGMRDFGSYYRDPFDMEEVAVLQGPSSVVFGRGSTGGVVNQASKAPGIAPFMAGTLNFGTDATKRVTFDIDQPLPKLGTGAAFRLNVMGNDSGVAGRDIAQNRRFGIAPSLALGLGTATRVTFSYFHQTGDDIPDYGVPWVFNQPAPVARNNYYGFKDGNFLRTYDDIGTVKVEHDVNSAVTVRNQARYANYARDVQITEPRLPTTATPTTPLSDIVITRNQLTADSVETYLVDQLDVTARFRTGAIRHTLVTGVEGSRETSDPTRPTFAGVPGTSLLNPDPYQAFAGIPKVTSKVDASAMSVAAYALDTLRFGEKWELTGGLRWDRFDASYEQSIAPVAAFNRIDKMASWRGALVYKPKPAGSVYFSYGTSFNPSAETLALSAANANIEPEKNKTYEAGSKWDLPNRRMSLRTAVFRTEKTNAREPDPTNPLQNVLSGNQRVDGFQLEAIGRVTDRWQMLGSYTLLDSEVVSSKFYPAAIGARLANVPRNTFSLWSDYQTPWHLALGGGSQFVDSRTASSTVPNDPLTGLLKQAPSYWVFHAMARYPLNDHLDLQLNVYNLTDKYYYDQLHPGHIVPGPGRTAMLGVKFKF